MRSDDIPIDDSDEASPLELSYRPPESRFTTPWLRRDLGLFRIDLTIIGPISEEPKGYFPLSRSEAEDILEAISDVIVFFREELRGENSSRS